DMGGGKTQIGGGRPGMTTVVPTTDGKWLLPYEFWGGGTNTRYVIADDPLKFYRGSTDNPVTSLPVDTGSRRLAVNGSPVVINLPDGRLVYNAAGSGNVWVNESGRSDGVWKEYQTTSPAGYSRNLQYVEGTGRISILNHQGTSTIRYSEVDQGRSEGAYYQLVNRKTGQVIGTGGKTNDANIGNGDVPDVRLEDAGSAANKDTQYWHVVNAPKGGTTLLNKSGGRMAGIWTGNATVGQRIGQWVDNSPTGVWNISKTADGYYKFQAAKNSSVFLTGASAGAPLTLQNAVEDGSQEWQLVQQAPASADLTKDRRSKRLTASSVGRNATLSLNAAASDPAGTALHANTTGHVYAYAADGKATDLGPVSFDEAQQGSVTLPKTIAGGEKIKIAVVFDDTPLIWDTVTVRTAATER
ncbi:RICIN domain-containing protein, partial [Streptomyces sp. HC44]